MKDQLSDTDRQIVLATQGGLPLAPAPYEELATTLGLDAEEVRGRMQRMLERGMIRRIGVVPNHYKLGFAANGMSVWDVEDTKISHCGRLVGALDFVSHAYHRPRRLPAWPYNLFAMVHGRTREEVAEKVEKVAAVLGDAQRGHDVLFSTRVLKKTGLRLNTQQPETRKTTEVS